MARGTSATKTTAVATPAAAAAAPVKPASAAVAAAKVPASAAATASAKTAGIAAAKAPKTDAAAKAAAAVPAVAAADAGDAAVAGDAPASSGIDKIESKLNNLSMIIKETLFELKALKKDYERMRKSVEKTERKRANARTNPNGFAKPTPITDELCVFLNLPAGSVMSRTDVTRKINAYIKEHNLNKPDNKRIILPDPSLRKILNVKEGEEVSFFSLQKFLSPLFKKAAAAAPVAAA